jgi:diguanylate cyclase (GGDEF)-like protein
VSNDKAVKKPVPAKSITLGRVLNQSEEIKESVAEAAIDLASVNVALKQEGKAGHPVQTIEASAAQNEAVEQKVAKAADDLHKVNAELAKEVAERIVIESELADTKTDLAEARDDLSTSRANEQEARQSSLQDAVTGLPNRALFEERLDHGLIQAKRQGWGLAVMFIDIDNFKSINDTHGHDLGDKVLVTVANRLKASVRGEDTVSRWGGDEFVCLLLDVKRETEVARIAEKMAGRIAEACEVDGTGVSIRVSIGVAVYPGDGTTADSLLKNADKAMYSAKGTETRVVLFRESASR